MENRGVLFTDTKDRLVFLFFGDTEASVRANAEAVLQAAAALARERTGGGVTVRTGGMVRTLEAVAASYAGTVEGLERERPPLEGEQLERQWKSAVNRTLDYIAAHYNEAVSLKQIAHLSGINPSYLGQIFRRGTGESFTGYVNRYRVQRARELLATTTLKVYEVSERVGFTDYHYFLKIFKKVTGIVPTDTRCDNFYHKN
jgi:AraC-like DNA-binding protein